MHWRSETVRLDRRCTEGTSKISGHGRIDALHHCERAFTHVWQRRQQASATPLCAPEIPCASLLDESVGQTKEERSATVARKLIRAMQAEVPHRWTLCRRANTRPLA
jgi:hypothetical protein